jgi:hypothetical protein
MPPHLLRCQGLGVGNYTLTLGRLEAGAPSTFAHLGYNSLVTFYDPTPRFSGNQTTYRKEDLMSLEDALNGLKNVVGDLTSIEVQTYVGDIDVVMDGVTGTSSLEDSLKKAKKSGTIKLTLVTKINFDGDGVVLVPSSAPADYIQEAHDSALMAGNEIRQGLITLFSDVIGLKISK